VEFKGHTTARLALLNSANVAHRDIGKGNKKNMALNISLAKQT